MRGIGAGGAGLTELARPRARQRWRTAPAVAALVALVLTAACSSPSRPSRQARARPGQAQSSAQILSSAAQIRAENALPGDPGWRITHPGSERQVEGYADHTDVLPGAPVRLFVSTTARSFRVRAFRFGWYGGDLARLVWTSPGVPGQLQRAARTVAPGGMVVAPWQPSLTVPTVGWPPGSYLLRLDTSTGAQSYLPLVIRSPSVAGREVLVQAVTSYQAYNGWGGSSLYNGPNGSFATRSRRVSFDRPYSPERGAGFFFQLEQPLVSLAERLGLPLAYLTSIDANLDPHVLDGAAAVISEAHDEYWSGSMRATFTRARDHGENLAFFGANAIYRKIRFQSSALGRDRIEVNYKVPQEDPLYGRDNALVTGNWPDPPDADPESSLTGQAYGCFSSRDYPLVVTDPGGWVWAGSGVHRGESLPGVVGPESDQVEVSSPTPRPVEVLARSPAACAYGSTTESDVSYYVARSRAGVFDAGTEGWVCALPGARCSDQAPGPLARRVIEAATRNILDAFAHGPAGLAHPAVDYVTGRVFP